MQLDGRGALAPSKTYNVRRRDPRYVASVPVTLQRFLRNVPRLTRGLSLDISVRGMGALVCSAPRVGETLVIRLSLPGAPVEILGTVRHSSEGRTGFEFLSLSGSAQQEIQDWIQELREREERLFPYPFASTAKFGSD